MDVGHFLKGIMCSTLALTYTPAHAQTPKETLVGLWGFDGCSNIEEIEYQGANLAAFSDVDGIEIIAQQITAVDNSEWLMVRTDEHDTAPALMRIENELLVQAWPKAEPETQEETETLHASLSSGLFSPDTNPDSFEILRGESCDSLPMPQAFAFGETLAVLKDIDQTLSKCQTSMSHCAHEFFNVADLSGDQELSIAEMARIVRASVSIGTAMDSDGSRNQNKIAATGAAAIAPIAAAAVLHSFDYDNSGTLSFEELLSERLPADLSKSNGLELNVSNWIDVISEGAKTAAATGAFLLR